VVIVPIFFVPAATATPATHARVRAPRGRGLAAACGQLGGPNATVGVP